MRLQHVIAISCLSIFLVIGAAFMALGLRNVWRGLVSTRWPTVMGSVSDSRVDVQTGTDRETNAPSVTYLAEITVDYRVDGRDYSTGTLAFGQTVGSGDSSEAELRRLRYPPGMPVSVSYDPSDPAVAVLRPGFDPEVLWLPGAGLGFFLPGLMFLLAYLSMAMNLPVMGVAWRLFGTIFALIGIAMLTVGVLNLSRARASLAWPVTRGVIVYGHRDSSTSVTRTEDGRSYRSTSQGTHLVYTYDADGTARFSNIR